MSQASGYPSYQQVIIFVLTLLRITVIIYKIAMSAAGAKFFVLTTKHHDGVALFDTQGTSHRSTVALGAHRDFIRELMDASKTLYPNLKRGTYFSLPVSVTPLTIE